MRTAERIEQAAQDAERVRDNQLYDMASRARAEAVVDALRWVLEEYMDAPYGGDDE